MFRGQRGLKSVCLLLALAVAGCVEVKERTTPPVAPAVSGTTPAVEASLAGQPGCEGAVLPSLKTIETGEYTPLSRPLFVYVNTKALQKPEVAGYVKMLLGPAQDKVESGGFIKLKPELLKAQLAKLDAATAGVKIPNKITAGTVSVNGSSTVFPFSVVAAELFQTAHDNKVNVSVGKKGTGGGFEKFCIGETDISNASRPIKQSEIDKCRENKVEYIELSVCIDGLTVCVNPENDWCHCLTVEQLHALWKPDSKIKKWNELNPAWPAEDIVLFGADADSGTFDYFTEVIVGKSKSSRQDYQQSSDDNTLVVGIAGDKHALGYFGFSYYDKNRETLKAIGIVPAKKIEKKAEEKRPEEKK